MVHASASSQLGGVPPSQNPPWQVSRPLQRSASSQNAPSIIAGHVVVSTWLAPVSPIAAAFNVTACATASLKLNSAWYAPMGTVTFVTAALQVPSL